MFSTIIIVVYSIHYSGPKLDDVLQFTLCTCVIKQIQDTLHKVALCSEMRIFI